MKRILFVINPNSVKKNNSRVLKAIGLGIDPAKFIVNKVYTEWAEHAIQISRDAVEDKVDIIVAVGGDGRVHGAASLPQDLQGDLGGQRLAGGGHGRGGDDLAARGRHAVRGAGAVWRANTNGSGGRGATLTIFCATGTIRSILSRILLIQAIRRVKAV